AGTRSSPGGTSSTPRWRLLAGREGGDLAGAQRNGVALRNTAPGTRLVVVGRHPRSGAGRGSTVAVGTRIARDLLDSLEDQPGGSVGSAEVVAPRLIRALVQVEPVTRVRGQPEPQDVARTLVVVPGDRKSVAEGTRGSRER